MCKPKVGFVEGEVVCDGASYKPRLFGPWMLLYGAGTLDTTLDVRAIETNAGLKVGWRTATVQEEAPDPWETLLTERTTNDTFTEAVSVTTKTSQLLLQAVVFGGLTTGTTAKTAHARLWYTLRDAGIVVARQRIQLYPSSSKIVSTVGRPFNCAGFTGLMFAVQFVGVQGTVSAPACLWRSFDSGDDRKPGAWSVLHSFGDVTADGGQNSGTLATTTSGKMMAQAGFRWSTTGTDPNAYVNVLVAGKM